MDCLVSIIVPVYNSEKYIKKCIESIINQKYKNIELIIIDDGSTDNSSSICRDYLKKDKRVKYYYKDNSGVSDSRNFGIEKCKGYFIMFVDSDDYIDNDYIYLMMNYAENNNFDFAISDNYIERNKRNKRVKTFNNKDMKVLEITSPFAIDNYFTSYNMCTACKTLFNRNFIINNNIRFNSNINFGEDMLFSITSYIKAKKAIYINLAGYHYVYNRKSASNNKNLKKSIKYCEDNYLLYESIEKLLNEANYKYNMQLINDACLNNYLTGVDDIVYSSNNVKTIIEEKNLMYKKYLKRFNLSESKISLIRKTRIYLLINNLNIFIFSSIIRKCLKKVKKILGG